MALPLVINPGDPGHIGDHEEIHALIDDVVSPFTVGPTAQGTLAGRPVAGQAGRRYFATDTDEEFYDDGAAWNQISPERIRRVRLYKNANQSIPDGGGGTALTWPSESYDPDSMHAGSSSDIIIPATENGVVYIDAQATFAGNSSGIRMLQIRVDGVVKKSVTASGHAAVGSVNQRLNISDNIEVAGSDVISIAAFQSSGGSLNVLGTDDDTGEGTRVAVLFFKDLA